MAQITCTRCAGRCYIEGFRHVEAGICFRCNGLGTEEYSERTMGRYLREVQAAAIAAKPTVEAQSGWATREQVARIHKASSVLNISIYDLFAGALASTSMDHWTATDADKVINHAIALYRARPPAVRAA